MANSHKKCKQCKEYFPALEGKQFRTGFFCGVDHAVTWANNRSAEKKKKDYNKVTNDMKAKLRSTDRSWWLKKVQTAFNTYIRARDHKQPCISCGRSTGAKVNAGHYKTVGGFPELRFNELNCWLQCEHCNSYLSGNITEYRKNLLIKIGPQKLEWLEGPHKPKKYTIQELVDLEKEFKDKLKAIKEAQ